MSDRPTVAARFYGAGGAVVALLLFTAATWWTAQEESARAVAGTAFLVALVIAVALALLLARDESSSLWQDPHAPGNRAYWRLLVGGVFLAIFDEALSGVPVFSATGFMTGFIASILLATLVRARR